MWPDLFHNWAVSVWISGISVKALLAWERLGWIWVKNDKQIHKNDVERVCWKAGSLMFQPVIIY